MSAPGAERCGECGARLTAEGHCAACLFDLGIGAPPPEDPPIPGRHRAGPYRLLEVLGEGGMGVVYLAEQERPIRRRVALKLIKPGMDNRQVIARFETERQALAMMSHPNVAKVLDAGVTEDGRSYFVMEHVPGVPITDACDRDHLSIPDRLALFLQACDALQHAHQKGIIHRDLKPSNLLVCLENDRPAVKVIDFGVAKAVDRKLTERTFHTEHGIVLGTPEYMSPEQAGGSAAAIDTRADIYSLGVILYELCVGVLPFSRRDLGESPDLEMLRIIREEDPPRPSRRLHSLGDAGHEVAHRRGTLVPSLMRLVSGELEWIMLKALEKRPAARYATASELGADIRRYLNHETVTARPPSAAYRIRKFVRRNRGAVAAAASILVALVAGLAASTALYFRAVEARDAARVEADKARAINDFIQQTLGSAEPGKQGRQTLVVDALRRAAERIDEAFVDQPEVRLGLHGTIGNVYFNLGMMAEAETEIRKVLDHEREVLGEEAPQTLETRQWLGLVHLQSRQHARAIEELTAVLDQARRTIGPENRITAETTHHLGNAWSLSGRLKEAEPVLLEALRLEEKVNGPDHFLTGTCHMSVATLYANSQRLDEAERHWMRALEILKETAGEAHWLTLRSRQELAAVWLRQGRLDRAEPLARETLALCRRELGEYHMETGASAGVLAEIEMELGNHAEAEGLLRDQVERHREVDMGDRVLPTALRRLAIVLARAGRDDAVEVAREAIAVTIATHGEPHFLIPGAWRALALALHRADRARDFDASAQAFRKAVGLYEDLYGETHPYLANTLQDFARMEHARGRHDAAVDLLDRALGIYGRLGFEAPWATSEIRSDLAECLLETGRHAEAERHLDIAWEFLRTRRGESDRITREAAGRRIAILETTGREGEATALRGRPPG